MGLTTAYFITIFVVMKKRIMREGEFPQAHLHFSDLTLNIINGIALCTLAFLNVLMYFPSAPHPTAESMNWTVVILPGIVLLATAYFYLYAKREYLGPITLVKRSDQEREWSGPMSRENIHS